MSLRLIRISLEIALIDDGKMALALYEWEIEEHFEDFISSLVRDNDEFLMIITEHSGDVAMLLLERSGNTLINEAARERLKEIWGDAYLPNMKVLIPEMAKTLRSGNLAVTGVKTVDENGNFLT